MWYFVSALVRLSIQWKTSGFLSSILTICEGFFPDFFTKDDMVMSPIRHDTSTPLKAIKLRTVTFNDTTQSSSHP